MKKSSEEQVAEQGVAITSPSTNANATPGSGGRRLLLKSLLVSGILAPQGSGINIHL